mgnify:CR=1 FL=1
MQTLSLISQRSRERAEGYRRTFKDQATNSKNTKLQESVVVQNSTNLAGYEKISNGSLEVFVDLKDGSIKEAFLYEKQARNGLYKTRLLSDDVLLKFYFKTSISGFNNESPFVVSQKQPDKISISSSDLVGNVLEKTFYFDGENVLKLYWYNNN